MHYIVIVILIIVSTVLIAGAVVVINEFDELLGFVSGCVALLLGVFLISLAFYLIDTGEQPASKVDTPEDALKVCIQHYNDTNQTYLISSMCYNNKK